MKAFISYAREREKNAKEVFLHLSEVGVDVFFDKVSLSPGDEWKRSLQESIKKSDLILLVVSKETSTKVGELQREIRIILEESARRPRGQTYLVPMRVGKASLPSELLEFQYFDYGSGGWAKTLLNSARSVAKRLGEDKTVNNIDRYLAKLEGDSPTIIEKISEKKKRYNVDIEFIQYRDSSNYFRFINSHIAKVALGDYYDFLRGMTDWVGRPGKSDLSVYVREHFSRDGIISLQKSYGDYWSGAAHPNHSLTTFNFGGEDCGLVQFEDLFEVSEDEAVKILKRCDDIFRVNSKSIGDDTDEFDVSFSTFVNPEYMTALSMLKNFNIDDRGITFNFGTGNGLPHVLGEQDVLVPWSIWNYKVNKYHGKTKIAKFITAAMNPYV
ncbi:toll/interleukin-1 receptor domain-containing protein [Mesorhizobium sp. M7A.F.Ca.MR.362.00.0.0]|uniref:toll/interleukin-1 receptor domain-containing protein n=1 Tax=Mesorhizobium sp. M7A.F.Ca.MR.362.00.0.0 TaxID=2496779 RepID=UPI000FD38B1A|nr:toll/interleukin-1 receptor domain-containing protein [Mesorhizobium sp. M7A.F.Ca.MR.362.00.0.0]RUU75153.1 toll/interleukin-1 receptor domain-containing protein [Mesorhizobium sp. M7A.F.Ca.MR.362.00.0.0]RWN92417.1 MAG: toll/interleukin-1 receptor domain-containing protein [Mesorhizobium sp.]